MSAFPQIVLHVHTDGTWSQSATPAGAAPADHSPARGAEDPGRDIVQTHLARQAGRGARAVADPFHVARALPELFSAYLRENCRSLNEVQRMLNCSERTARDLWAGNGSPSTKFMVIAYCRDPERIGALMARAGTE